MREIKFRTWDSVKHELSYVEEFFQKDNKLPQLPMYWGLCEIMQFTGLKDKNGKEIYEGDIVGAEEYLGFKNLKAEVIFNRGRFCLNTGTIPEDLIPELCKVIGNIYENPELLTEKPHSN